MSRKFLWYLVTAIAVMAVWSCRSRSNSGPLFPAPMVPRWGFIDRAGRTIIDAHFDGVRGFSEGLAAVMMNGRWGYIDRTGRVRIPAVQRLAQDFHGGLAIVDSGLPEHPFGLMDSSGAWVVPPSFRSLVPGDDAGNLFLGQLKAGEETTFFDRAGQAVLGPYAMAFPFSQGRARVEIGSDNVVIDSSGTVVTKEGLVLDGTRFAEGLIAVRRDRRLGYMDVDGNIVVQPQYDQGGAFAEGLAPVQSEGHWIFINKSGAVTAEFPSGVAFAEPLAEGRSLVSADRDEPGRKFGYVDRNGRWAVKPVWDEAEPFHDGLARVGTWRTKKMAYIDPDGKVVWESSGGAIE